MPKAFEYVNQLTYQSFDEAMAIAKATPAIRKVAGIIHDQCVNANGEPVKPHFHIMCQLHDNVPIEYIAKWFGVEPERIQKIKAPSYAKALPYLIHINKPNKHQYSASDVVANFDYDDVIYKYKKEETIQDIIDKILSGEIRQYNINLIPDNIYINYEKKINQAFKKRQLNLLANGNKREMEVIYIYGDGGVGKSTYAREYCKSKGLSYAESSDDNDVFQDYQGQDVFIMDDPNFSHKHIKSMLRLLDNNYSSSAKSRYNNKHLMECKLLIITSNDTVEKTFSKLSGTYMEKIYPLIRRITYKIHITTTTISVDALDEVKQDYVPVAEYQNKIHELHPPKVINEEVKAALTERFDIMGK